MLHVGNRVRLADDSAIRGTIVQHNPGTWPDLYPGLYFLVEWDYGKTALITANAIKAARGRLPQSQ